MFVADYMTEPAITVKENERLVDVELLLRKHNIHQLPVVDNADRLTGIITDRDVRSTVGYDRSLGEALTVGEVMTANPETIRLDATLDDALVMFCGLRFGALPVVRKERLVGILTRHDLLVAFYEILGMNWAGSRLEVVLKNGPTDLATAIDVLREVEKSIISAVISPTHKGGNDPVLYLRVRRDAAKTLDRQFRHAGLTLLDTEPAHRPRSL